MPTRIPWDDKRDMENSSSGRVQNDDFCALFSREVATQRILIPKSNGSRSPQLMVNLSLLESSGALSTYINLKILIGSGFKAKERDSVREPHAP